MQIRRTLKPQAETRDFCVANSRFVGTSEHRVLDLCAMQRLRAANVFAASFFEFSFGYVARVHDLVECERCLRWAACVLHTRRRCTSPVLYILWADEVTAYLPGVAVNRDH